MFEALLSIKNIIFTVPLAGFGTDTYPVSLVELWSTILGLWCVIAFRKNSKWAYPIGILNSIGFIAIFYQIQLYSDLLLNFYFIGISILGWIWWNKKNVVGEDELKIRYMSASGCMALGATIGFSTIILGSNIDVVFNFLATSVAWVLGKEYTHIAAAYPYWDASTTVMSFLAMYLLAKRYVESWILWVIVDVICIGLYYVKGVHALSVEYFIFLLNAVYAVYQWNKEATNDQT